MALPQDPIMLMSMVNTLLRSRYSCLDALCEGEDVNKAILCDKLAAVGYTYNPDLNQFR